MVWADSEVVLEFESVYLSLVLVGAAVSGVNSQLGLVHLSI